MNDSTFVSLAWTQLIQVSVLIALVWMLVKLFARNRPHLAHALWLLVLVKCVTPPLIGSSAGLFSHLSMPSPFWRTSRDSFEEQRMPIEPIAEVRSANANSELNVRIDDLSSGIAMDEAMLAERFGSVTPGLHDVPADREPIAETASIPIWFFWLGSAGFFLLLTCVRVLIALRRVTRHQVETPAALERQVAELSRRLGLRRTVKILVTASRVGPAVVGWFRPLLILPDVIVFSCRDRADGCPSAHDTDLRLLEPILAHELLHVKRGDLGVGWLQVTVQSLWWFHPLVWLVNRFLSREAERCCDEAVVAELRCSPIQYARSLLTVLEQKRNLHPIPACPGVKPVELTKQRMERIMQLEQGCRKRSPWWCWAVVVILGLAVLPGRGASDANEPRPETNRFADEASAAVDNTERSDPQLQPTADTLDISCSQDQHDLIARLLAERRKACGIAAPPADDAPSPYSSQPGQSTRALPQPAAIDVRETVQLRIVGPQRSNVTVHVDDELQTRHQLVLPGRVNLHAGKTYALTLERLSDRETDSDRTETHWSVEIPKIDRRSEGYLIHNSIPLELTDEDFAQVAANNSVTKVVYLPQASQQDERAIPNVETLASTRLDPGRDAVEEAERRGTVLAVLRSQAMEKAQAERFESGMLFLKVYPVADLVVPQYPVDIPPADFFPPPVPNSPKAASPEPSGKSKLPTTLSQPWMPIQQQENSSPPTPPEPSPKAKAAIAQNLNSLAELIKESIPVENGWLQNDREAVLTDPSTMSLLVRATDSTHDEIASLLRSLRRQQDFQVTLECLTVRFENNSFQKFWEEGRVATTPTLDASVQNSMTPLLFHNIDRTVFKTNVGMCEHASIVSFPKITVFNGVGAQIQISELVPEDGTADNLHYMIVPTISDDRRTIDVKLAVNPTSPLDILSKAKALTIRDGHSVLIEVTDEVLASANVSGTPEVRKALRNLKKKELAARTFVLLTPRIIVLEEEEELPIVPE